jgi:hypothetical protein
MNTNLKTSEIAEAARVFIESGYDVEGLRSLIELVEDQTDYVQKRFWKIVDQSR